MINKDENYSFFFCPKNPSMNKGSEPIFAVSYVCFGGFFYLNIQGLMDVK